MNFFKHKLLVTQSQRAFSLEQWQRRLIFWGGGILVGFVCVAFAILCDHADQWFHHWVANGIFRFLPIILTPVGFMVIVFFTRRYFPGSEGSGIPQVIAALQTEDAGLRKKLVSMRIAIGKFVLGTCGFLTGASMGREGPTIQLSASIMHALGRFAKFNREDLNKGLLMAGGAAGIAAAFNTPLAGIMFALEELSASFEKGVSGTIITTVVLSGIVAQALLGNYLYFGRSTATIDILQGWSVVLWVSILAGIAGGIFSLLLVRVSSWLRPRVVAHPLRVAGILGLIVAVIGVLSHGLTYGSGYHEAKTLLMAEPGQSTVISIFYGPLKFLATLLTYFSGIPGGIFAPSLSAGAGFGLLLSHLFNPQYQQAIILIATVSYFSAVVQSPITAFVIVLEMTDTTASNLLLPIMIASLIATGVSRMMGQSLYHQLAMRYLPVVEKHETPGV